MTNQESGQGRPPAQPSQAEGERETVEEELDEQEEREQIETRDQAI